MGYNFYSVSTNKGQLPSLQQLVLSLLDEKQKWNEEKGNAFTSETTKKKRGGGRQNDFSMCLVNVPQPGHARERVPSAMGYCLGILRKKAIVTQEAES